MDADIKPLLIRVRDLLVPALVSGMPGAGLDYEAAGQLLEDVLIALQKDTENRP